jgi:hypothetical protein
MSIPARSSLQHHCDPVIALPRPRFPVEYSTVAEFIDPLREAGFNSRNRTLDSDTGQLNDFGRRQKKCSSNPKTMTINCQYSFRILQ